MNSGKQFLGNKKTYLLVISFLVLVCLDLASCTLPLFTGFLTKKAVAPEYKQPSAQLHSRDCGKCHINIFNLIKNDGGKHRIRCRRCHEQFHNYKPGTTKRADVLPKCSQCHNKPHGDKLVKCLNCHQQVHTPLIIPVSNTLTLGCDQCHPKIDKEIKIFVSQHSNFYCTICHHTRHGYIPECMECHQPHTEAMFQPDCLVCHNPHKALEVTYPDGMPNRVCAICHRLAYDTLLSSGTKHAAFSCTKCHPEKHRTIKSCQDCHAKPHDETILRKAKLCGDCHGIAHSLVIR